MKLMMSILVPTLCLLVNPVVFADIRGGGFHGAGGYHDNRIYNNGYHNGNYHGYHNNVWYGGGDAVVNVHNGNDDYWYDDGLNDESTNVVIGVPDGGYYDPSCQVVQTCNPDGECITQQNCN